MKQQPTNNQLEASNQSGKRSNSGREQPTNNQQNRAAATQGKPPFIVSLKRHEPRKTPASDPEKIPYLKQNRAEQNTRQNCKYENNMKNYEKKS